MFVSSRTSLDRRRPFHGKYLQSFLIAVLLIQDSFKTLLRELFNDTTMQIDNGLMTPTMKIRRDMVVAKYKEEIDQLYS